MAHVSRKLESVSDEIQASLDAGKGTAERVRPLSVVNVEGRQAYVLYFDVLGFREMLKDGPALAEKYRRVMARLRNFVHTERLLEDSAGVHAKGFFNASHLVIFSDSGFVLMKDDSEQSFREICALANLCFAECLREELPVRGAIAAGELWSYPAEDVFFGTAVQNAYELAEALECVGIVTTETRWPESTSEEIRVPLRGGGMIGLRAPLASFGPGIVAPFSAWQETYRRLRERALKARNLRAVAKYDGSADLVASTIGNFGDAR